MSAHIETSAAGTPAAGGAARAARRLQIGPVVWDVLLILGYLLIASYLVIPDVPEQGPILTRGVLIAAALAVGGVVVLVIRRRHPLVAFAGAVVLVAVSASFGTAAEAVPLLVCLFDAGARRSAKAAWTSFGVVVALGALVIAPVMSNRLRNGPRLWAVQPRTADLPEDLLTDWLNVAAVAVGMALIAVLAGITVGQRRRYITTLVDRAEQLQRERDQQGVIARADERERIAREMHDVIAHSIAVMIALADGAQAAVARRPESAQDAIARVSETGRSTLVEVRRLLGTVRDDDDRQPTTPGSPTVEQLPALVEELRGAGLPVRLELHGQLADDPVLEFTVYRIVQESLTNVLRHADGVRDVLVAVDLSPTAATVTVEDWADVAADDAEAGRGLLGIRERVTFYDGKVDAGPKPDGGWKVSATLPARSR